MHVVKRNPFLHINRSSHKDREESAGEDGCTYRLFRNTIRFEDGLRSEDEDGTMRDDAPARGGCVKHTKLHTSPH